MNDHSVTTNVSTSQKLHYFLTPIIAAEFMPLPPQRWKISPPAPEPVAEIARLTGLPDILAQVLVNRQIDTPEAAQRFLDPEGEALPDPNAAFPDLGKALDRLERAIRQRERLAICGDYDVDGMTSTALLLRTFRVLGAQADYEIPSRMTEGYGINERIVRELGDRGVGVIVTVDNGIAAHAPIALAESLGIAVIVTDHHDLPPTLPPATAILNPKYGLPPDSPYAAIAGVGVAYVLALELAARFDCRDLIAQPLLELFALGTIADLAALTGINRRLVQRGLRMLSQSKLVGVTALINESGIARDKQAGLKPEAIGFGLGPRINAIGRIGDPAVVIELLSTDDMGKAIPLAQACERTNRQRQDLCAQIEREAVAWVAGRMADGVLDLQQERVLVLVDREVQAYLQARSPQQIEMDGWHHGVIGIVASRLVERYGAPVFIGSVEAGEGEEETTIRFSARGIPEFHVFEALEYIKDIRLKGGGHKAAGGFTLPAAHLPLLRDRLRAFAAQAGITAAHICPVLEVDARADLSAMTLTLFEDMQRLQPCGVGNPDPVFYTPNVRVVSQQRRGKKEGDNRSRKPEHLALEIDRGDGTTMRAIAWRWGEHCPLPDRVDVAYKLRVNHWQDKTSVELEIVGARAPQGESLSPVLAWRAAPPLAIAPDWQPLDGMVAEQRAPIVEGSRSTIPTEPILLYGYDRPLAHFAGLDVDCDRPRRTYASLVLWSLPPSITHLQWLLALAQPQRVFVGDAVPELPTAEDLRARVNQLRHAPQLNLLDLGQQWWVSPSAIVAALRDVGVACEGFAPTGSLDDELDRLHRWYRLPVARLAEICTAVRER